MTENNYGFGEHPLKISAFTFAGLAMMLNIRLVYSASPYALLRFKLPENLFSVFVRVMASSLELWCLPSMVIANIMDYFRAIYDKQWHDWEYHYQSIFWSWANFVTFVILWISFIIGGDQGNVTAFYWVIAASGFVFGINMVMVYAMEFQYLPWYMIGENSFPMLTSLMHYVGTLLFGNRRKWNSDYIIVTIDIVISLAISLVASLLWTLAYWKGEGDGFGASDPNQRVCKILSVSGTAELTYSLDPNWGANNHATYDGNNGCGHKKSVAYYLHFIPPSLMVLIGMGLVYTIYPGIAPGMIVPFHLIDKIEMVLLIATAFPPVIIGIMKQYNINPYIAMGNWGTYHQKSCKGGGDLVSGGGTTGKCDCSSGRSLTGNPTLYLHNTTITSTDGLKAIATIKVTDNSSGRDYTGQITNITTGTLRKTSGGGELKTNTPLVAGDILNLNGQGTGTGGSIQITINGTIIVTKAGTLGGSLTLEGRLDGTLSLKNGSNTSSITVNKGDSDRLEAKTLTNLALEGITISSGGLTGTATMEITTTNPDTDDLTNITEQINITISKITKGKVAILKEDGPLKRETTLKPNDTLNLLGTANGDGKNFKVTGTITIGSGGTLESGLQFRDDVTSSGNLQFTNVDDGVAVTGSGSGTGTLTLDQAKLDVLKNTNFSLTIPGSTNKLTYELVTKSKITVGTKTTTIVKVKLSGLSIVPACTTITNTNGLEADLTDITFTQTVAGLKEHTGQNINLSTGLRNASVEITKDNVKGLSNGNLDTQTKLQPGDTLNLNITKSGTTLTGTINVKSDGKSLGTNLTLKGGIETSINGLSGGSGKLTASSVSITSLKYDPDEFHVNHKDTLCCYWGAKVFKWSDSNPKNEPWHIPVILGPFQICLAITLVYSLHYKDSNISRSIVNQPKMSTALSIIFYMCHEIQLALGFPGIASDPNILLPMQLVGAFLMVLLAFYSVGYITEYKRSDPLNWPTEGMTTWNSLCYWLKMASKITNKNFKQLFTTDLRRDLLLCIQKNELI